MVPTGSKRGPKGKSVEEDMELTEGSPGTESSTAPQTRGHRYSTDRKTSPKSLHQSPPPPAAMLGTPPLAIRERLYPVSTPGKKYFVTMNVDPEQEGDLHLTRGMSIDGMLNTILKYSQGYSPRFFPKNGSKIIPNFYYIFLYILMYLCCVASLS